MQAGGFLNYRLKYCWPKLIYLWHPRELKQGIKTKTWGQPKFWGAMAHSGP